jgi:tripeptide aminopeptidase
MQKSGTALRAHVTKEKLLDEFFHLVSLDAESYEEREAADYVTSRLLALGLSVEEDTAGEQLAALSAKSGKDPSKRAGNICGFLKGNAPGEPVLFSSHMDTVPPGKGKRAILHEDGRITSEGDTVLGADDAAGIAAILAALDTIQAQNLPHPDIEVLFPVAEEPYAQGSRLFDYTKLRAKKAYVLDLSGAVGTAAIAAPSIVSFRVAVEGKSAHAGFCPEEGIHAIAIAARALAAFPGGRVAPDTTVNFGTITGGRAQNIIPDSCVISGEIRSMDHGKALEQMQKIKSVFSKEAAKDGGAVCFDVTEEIKAYSIDRNEPVVQQFEEACGALGFAPELITTFGGSDNNHFAVHGIRGIVTACAMNDVHTTGEYTTAEELTRSAELVLWLMTHSSL